MDKKDYTKLDAAILEQLLAGNKKFVGLSVRLEAIATPFASEKAEPWRVIDRRLQALRKTGLVSYSRVEGWAVTSPEMSSRANQ